MELGLANIAPLKHLQPAQAPRGFYGKGATRSPGKDTTTGHWEMAGVWLEQAFPVYKHGFPPEVLEPFEKQIGRKTLGNKPASGQNYQGAGRGTRADGETDCVHVGRQRVPDCGARRGDPDRGAVSHVRNRPQIAGWEAPRGARDCAPFTGTPGNFTRTSRRHDYAVDPPSRCCWMC